MSMKYDAGMTQYHDDIVAALRDMLHGEMDKIAELAAEGSPVPLREYLRNNHGKAIHGGNKFEAMSSCFLVPFDHVINNKGDSKLNLSWSQVTSFIRKYPADFFRKSEDEEASLCDDCTVPTKPETTVTFDYSELDSDTAAKLESVTAEIYNVRKEYIFTMAKKVAYAHDLLANCGNGKFGAWCESIGITRQTGNNLIQIVKLFDNSTAEEQINLNKLTDGNVKLLYETAKPSAPPELVEQVKSGDITTHKEYIELKKQLEAQMQRYSKALDENHSLHSENQELRRDRVNAMNRADNAERELSDAKAEIEKLSREADEADREYDAMADRECHYETEICELKHQIKELEAQPRDVAVQADPEAEQRISELEEELAELREHNEELDFGYGSDSLSADQLSEIYETLHGKVLSALKDCKAFINMSNLPQIVKDRASGRFGTLKELIEWYMEEME